MMQNTDTSDFQIRMWLQTYKCKRCVKLLCCIVKKGLRQRMWGHTHTRVIIPPLVVATILVRWGWEGRAKKWQHGKGSRSIYVWKHVTHIYVTIRWGICTGMHKYFMCKHHVGDCLEMEVHRLDQHLYENSTSSWQKCTSMSCRATWSTGWSCLNCTRQLQGGYKHPKVKKCQLLPDMHAVGSPCPFQHRCKWPYWTDHRWRHWTVKELDQFANGEDILTAVQHKAVQISTSHLQTHGTNIQIYILYFTYCNILTPLPHSCHGLTNT
jgi:hypothetical protein